MSQRGQVYRVTSVDGTHFTTALAQNAAELESLTMPGGKRGRYRIVAAVVVSSDNLAWEFWVERTAAPHNPDVNLDVFCGRWSWVAGDAVRIAAAGNYYYYIDGLDIAVEDTGESGQLHLELVNRSAGAKTAYAAGGHFRLELLIEPTLGW
jgi:hypothetical protein